MTEQRVYPRWSVNVPVSFSGEQLSGEGTITSLSLGGCAVNALVAAPTKSILALSIHLPNEDDPVTVNSAEVRWAARGRFGVQFLSVRQGNLERLHRFLQTCGPQTS